jgi:hypothetical protein
MIHHVSVGSNDLPRAKGFHRPLMALIGFRLLKETDKATLRCVGYCFQHRDAGGRSSGDRWERRPYRLSGA